MRHHHRYHGSGTLLAIMSKLSVIDFPFSRENVGEQTVHVAYRSSGDKYSFASPPHQALNHNSQLTCRRPALLSQVGEPMCPRPRRYFRRIPIVMASLCRRNKIGADAASKYQTQRPALPFAMRPQVSPFESPRTRHEVRAWVRSIDYKLAHAHASACVRCDKLECEDHVKSNNAGEAERSPRCLMPSQIFVFTYMYDDG